MARRTRPRRRAARPRASPHRPRAAAGGTGGQRAGRDAVCAPERAEIELEIASWPARHPLRDRPRLPRAVVVAPAGWRRLAIAASRGRRLSLRGAARPGRRPLAHPLLGLASRPRWSRVRRRRAADRRRPARRARLQDARSWRRCGVDSAGGRRLICVLQFDAASVAVLDRLLGEGRLPNLAALRERRAPGTSSRPRRSTSPPAPSTRSTAASSSPTTGSSTRSSGRRPSSASATRPRSTRRPRSGSASRPPGCGRWRSTPTRAARPRDANGVFVCGWGFCRPGRAPALVASRAAARELRAPLRPRPRGDRDLRPPATARARCACARSWSPPRGGSPPWPSSCSAARRFDLAWLTFSAAHLAGHQFWDLSQVDARRARPRVPRDARARARRRLRRRRRGDRTGRSRRCRPAAT